MGNEIVQAKCPICSYGVAVPFFNGGMQTLATLGWPTSAEDAQKMMRHAHDFVLCPACSHIWNCSFNYDAIPYKKNPNRMFNIGEVWKGHLANTHDLVLNYLPEGPIVIDVGCGEGHFVRKLAEARKGQGRFLGFDPNITPESGRGVEFYAEFFHPLFDIERFMPDLIVIRHVLEHLERPATFLEEIVWGAKNLKKPCFLFVEVPCIDRAVHNGRLVDFFFEHISHFTTDSFRVALGRCGRVVEFGHGYDGEVIFALVELGVSDMMQERVLLAQEFSRGAVSSRIGIRHELDALADSGKRVAIWGGTGKAAAFIHQFNVDAKRFPIVVDSDPEKVGTFVSGSGQQIVYRDFLKTQPVEVIIIPTQWRAKDIFREIAREGIAFENILIEHRGKLIDYINDEHPYN